MNVKLGDEVKDIVSGFQGIAVSSHTYLMGCDRITVQPPYNKKEGKLPESHTFDEPQLKVIKNKIIPKALKKPGGPEKYSDEGR